MTMMVRRLIVLFTCLVAVCASGAYATAEGVPDASQPNPPVVIAFGEPPAEEARDQRLLEEASAAIQESGIPGLGAHRRTLLKVLANAPDDYPMYVLEGSDWLVRAHDKEDVLAFFVLAERAVAEGHKPIRIIVMHNVYPAAALMLGSEAVERAAYKDAINALEVGLRLQPNNGALIGEKAVALGALGRQDEALKLIEAALRAEDIAMIPHLGRLHRQRGFLLIELDRLSEARAAYEASLEHDPGNRLALQQLTYIEHRELGGKQWAPGVVRSKDYSDDDVNPPADDTAR